MSELTVKGKLDDSAIQRAEEDWKRRLRVLNYQIAETDYSLSRVARKSLLVVGSVTRTLEALGRIMPGAVDPAFDAIYQCIITTVSSLTSIAAAYAAGGITAPFAVIVESAAIGLSIFGTALALQGQKEASREIMRMNMEIRNLGTQVYSLRSSLSNIGGVFD